MLLRKHLLNLRLKNVITENLERIVTFEFEGFDEVDDIITKKLVVELMGKHCNIILLDSNQMIVDSLRHIGEDLDDPFRRKVVPHVRYIYPHNSKFNFLDVLSFDSFMDKITFNFAKECKSYNESFVKLDIKTLSTRISDLFQGISKSFVQCVIDELQINDTSENSLKQIYDYIKQTILNTDNLELDFELLSNDYFLVPRKPLNKQFNLSFYLDDFYYKKESMQEFKSYRDTVLKLILETLKKYKKRLINIDSKLNSCENMDKYKLYGELITANLYKLNDKKLDNIILENYYDNNKLIDIPLDSKYSPQENAKLFFKKYNKLKNTLEIVSQQKKETLEDLNYIESIVYELENCSTIDDVSEIFEEISENDIFKTNLKISNKTKKSSIKKTSFTKNKLTSFNPIKYNIDGYTILVGRNNKENDYLTLKYAKKTDIWFHTKDIHGSHVILSLNNKIVNDDILLKCAEISAKHSKAKKSSNVPVDFCEVKFVKKPNGAKPGMVIYSNNKTLYVTPK